MGCEWSEDVSPTNILIVHVKSLTSTSKYAQSLAGVMHVRISKVVPEPFIEHAPGARKAHVLS